MNDLLETLLFRLCAGQAVVRAAIVTQEGSAPRTAGALMLVFTDGSIAGTVGGGLVEARVMEAAAGVLADGRRRIMRFDLTGEIAAGADMICGGRLDIFLERISPDRSGFFADLGGRLEAGERCLLATPLDAELPAALLSETGDALDPGGLSPGDIAVLHAAGADIRAPIVAEAGGRRYFLEPCQGRPRVFLVGAGHVSVATAQVAALAGFSAIVLDDRPDFANRQRFPTAAGVAVTDLDDCFRGQNLTGRDLVVIVTRGHVHDASVLAQTLATPAGYVGMIGSRRKRDAIYDRLRAEGFSDAALARVHCPIGLPIGAETPEEIAVSIVAELIAARRKEGGSMA
jgi:xanthine dehydrogenase accessory factor